MNVAYLTVLAAHAAASLGLAAVCQLMQGPVSETLDRDLNRDPVM